MSLSGCRPTRVRSLLSRNLLPALGPRSTASSAVPGGSAATAAASAASTSAASVSTSLAGTEIVDVVSATRSPDSRTRGVPQCAQNREPSGLASPHAVQYTLGISSLSLPFIPWGAAAGAAPAVAGIRASSGGTVNVTGAGAGRSAGLTRSVPLRPRRLASTQLDRGSQPPRRASSRRLRHILAAPPPCHRDGPAAARRPGCPDHCQPEQRLSHDLAAPRRYSGVPGRLR